MLKKIIWTIETLLVLVFVIFFIKFNSQPYLGIAQNILALLAIFILIFLINTGILIKLIFYPEDGTYEVRED